MNANTPPELSRSPNFDDGVHTIILSEKINAHRRKRLLEEITSHAEQCCGFVATLGPNIIEADLNSNQAAALRGWRGVVSVTRQLPIKFAKFVVKIDPKLSKNERNEVAEEIRYFVEQEGLTTFKKSYSTGDVIADLSPKLVYILNEFPGITTIIGDDQYHLFSENASDADSDEVSCSSNLDPS